MKKAPALSDRRLRIRDMQDSDPSPEHTREPESEDPVKADPRWQQAKELFEQALAYRVDERRRFLETVCPADPALRVDVEELLANHERDPRFLDQPAHLAPGGAAASAPEPPKVPDYEAIRMLGQGAFGHVWLARSRTDVYRAVKVIPKGAVTELDFEGVRNLERQSRGHPALVPIRHVGETVDGAAYYNVMDLADGRSGAATLDPMLYEPRTLESDLTSGRLATADDAAGVIRRVLEGLAHLHERELLHRDVKPANVIYIEGQACIADVGLISSGRMPGLGRTPLYAPPEGVVDASGDLYCVGRMFSQLLARLPAREFVNVDDVAQAVPEESSAYRAIIARACAEAPQRRFRSAREFIEALDRVQGVGRGAGTRTRVALLVLVPLVIAALGIWALGNRERVTDPGPGLARQVPAALTLVSYGTLFEDEITGEYTALVPTKLPLRSGQQLFLRCELVPEGYPLLFLWNSGGEPELVYPASNTTPRPVSRLRIPEKRVFVLQPAARTLESVTLLLLASAEPVADPEALRQRLLALGPAPEVDRHRILELEDGAVRILAKPGSRSLGPEDTRRAKQGTLTRIAGELADEFPVIRAITFPQVSESPQKHRK